MQQVHGCYTKRILIEHYGIVASPQQVKDIH